MKGNDKNKKTDDFNELGKVGLQMLRTFKIQTKFIVMWSISKGSDKVMMNKTIKYAQLENSNKW